MWKTSPRCHWSLVAIPGRKLPTGGTDPYFCTATIGGQKCLCTERKVRIECYLEYRWQLDGDSWVTKRVINTTQKDWMNMDEWVSTNSCCPCHCSRRCCCRLILHLVPMAGLQDITNGALKQRFIVLILQVESRDGFFWGEKLRLGKYLLVCSVSAACFDLTWNEVLQHGFTSICNVESWIHTWEPNHFLQRCDYCGRWLDLLAWLSELFSGLEF